MHFTGSKCDVSLYTDAYNTIKIVSIVTSGTVYTSRETGQTYILVFHEGLWMRYQMENTLINHNQILYYNTEVQDNQFSNLPLLIMTEDGDYSMPLDVNGITIFAYKRTLTQRELDKSPHIILTLQHPWDPHSVRLPRTYSSVQDEVETRQSNISAVDSRPKYYEANMYKFEEDGDNGTVLFDVDDMSRRGI